MAILGVIACRQIAGIADSPPEALTAAACGLTYGTDSCASCIATSCCAESTACAASPVCSPLASCLGKCDGDATCQSHCTIDNPVGAAVETDVSALSACIASSCESACGLTCGALAASISPPDAAAGCQSCLEVNACPLAQSCASSVDCDVDQRCVVGCPTIELRPGVPGNARCGTGAALRLLSGLERKLRDPVWAGELLGLRGP